VASLKLDKKRKTWLVADHHLGEDRFEIMNRPFTRAGDHVDCMLMNHNQLVGKDDLVIHLGDVCYQNAPNWLHYIKLFHGEKWLIRGNHDRVFTDGQLSLYFTKIIKEGDGLEIDGLGFPAYATHYPSRGRLDCFNAVGHIHAAWKCQLNMLNVGVDVNHFRPTDVESLRFYYKAVSDFYDEDVWVAYQPVNQNYRGRRGKSGSYFKEESK